MAGAGPGPDIGVIGDTGKSEGVRPSPDASEEVPLSRPSDICGGEVGDGAAVDGSLRDVAMGDEALQPVGYEGVGVVVEGGHFG